MFYGVCLTENKFFFLFSGPKTVFFWAPAFKWVSLSKQTQIQVKVNIVIGLM